MYRVTRELYIKLFPRLITHIHFTYIHTYEYVLFCSKQYKA